MVIKLTTNNNKKYIVKSLIYEFIARLLDTIHGENQQPPFAVKRRFASSTKLWFDQCVSICTLLYSTRPLVSTYYFKVQVDRKQQTMKSSFRNQLIPNIIYHLLFLCMSWIYDTCHSASTAHRIHSLALIGNGREVEKINQVFAVENRWFMCIRWLA